MISGTMVEGTGIRARLEGVSPIDSFVSKSSAIAGEMSTHMRYIEDSRGRLGDMRKARKWLIVERVLRFSCDYCRR